jgi:hypothetical protein
VALLSIGWILAPHPLEWTAWALSIYFVPSLLGSSRDLLNKPADLPFLRHLSQLGMAASFNLGRALIATACLPHAAFSSLDAIGRTLWRLLVSRRHLLQWSPSSEAERTTGTDFGAVLRAMWIGPAWSGAMAIVLWRANVAAWPAAFPILLLWTCSAALMWALGRPRERRLASLSPDQCAFLRRLARRTWGFFEVHVDQSNHWLPPDNIQEHPDLVIARRTSPTNIGLALLANLSAYDFGYLSIGTNDPRDGMSSGETLTNIAWMIDRWLEAGHRADHLIVTTLAPIPGSLSQRLPALNQGILDVAMSRGVQIIDLAGYVSHDAGRTWRSAELHVGDQLHYSESVRDWLAREIVDRMDRVVSRRPSPAQVADVVR